MYIIELLNLEVKFDDCKTVRYINGGNCNMRYPRYF